MSRDRRTGEAAHWRCNRASVTSVEVEIICSDLDEHRKRIETRVSDIADLKLPTWKDVVVREYERWEREHIIIDTAGRTIEECVEMLTNQLPRRTASV